MTATTVTTVGHGTLPAETFAGLIRDAGLGRIVDVRSYPGSKRNPQFGREEMARWLPGAGLEYHWIPDLGGRRRPRAGSRHIALRNDAFRAYADHMETPAFAGGIAELLELAGDRRMAVMCSESLWWRCHRRLLADRLVLLDAVEVVHLLHDGHLGTHSPTPGVRREDGSLVYDVGVQAPLLGD